MRRLLVLDLSRVLEQEPTDSNMKSIVDKHSESEHREETKREMHK